MKTTAELNYDGYIIQIVAEYNEPERGCRDSWGAPLEPDYDGYFDIISTHIDDVEYKDSKELAWFLQTSELYIDELMQEALSEAYEAELDAYYESQIDMQYYD